MRPITLSLTLEQVLEFVQNLPKEYKEAVKQKLEEDKIEEKAKENIISNFVGVEEESNKEEIDSSVTTDEKKEVVLSDIETIQNKIEKLQENNELESLQKDFHQKKRKAKTQSSKKSIVDEISGIIQDNNLPDYKELRDASIIENYQQKS